MEPREGHADDLEDRVAEQAADHADEQVAGDVARDGLGAVPADRSDALGAVLPEEGERALHELWPLEDHEERQHEDRHDARDAGGRASEESERRGAEAAHQRADTALVPLDVRQHVGAVQQVADRAAPRAGVLHHSRQLTGQRRPLPRQRHREERDQGGEDREHQQENGQRGERPPTPWQAALDPVHHRIERDREEGRDDDPHQHPVNLPDQKQQQGSREDEPDRGQDRAHGHPFPCLLACTARSRGAACGVPELGQGS